MKRIATCAVVLCFVAALAVAQEAAEKPWFDLQNCVFCKEVAAQPGLLEHMNTEYHNISSGFLSISKVDDEYLPAYEKMKAGMKKVITDMQTTGKIPYMCQHCSKYGEFAMAGVKMEEVETGYGIIHMAMSSDSTVVTKLQEFAKRTDTESKKYKKEMAGKK
ncbi:MAG: hypothetical protein AB1644_00125 [Candidatus Zixiibacteriota bacterium]